MRISDWSSDVCSSDLEVDGGLLFTVGVVVIRCGDRIAHELLELVPGHDHRAAGEVGRRPRGAAPQDGAVPDRRSLVGIERSEEHTSELQSLMRNSYDVFCLKKTTKNKRPKQHTNIH